MSEAARTNARVPASAYRNPAMASEHESSYQDLLAAQCAYRDIDASTLVLRKTERNLYQLKHWSREDGTGVRLEWDNRNIAYAIRDEKGACLEVVRRNGHYAVNVERRGKKAVLCYRAELAEGADWLEPVLVTSAAEAIALVCSMAERVALAPFE